MKVIREIYTEVPAQYIYEIPVEKLAVYFLSLIHIFITEGNVIIGINNFDKLLIAIGGRVIPVNSGGRG